jgi:hypothetical protein
MRQALSCRNTKGQVCIGTTAATANRCVNQSPFLQLFFLAVESRIVLLATFLAQTLTEKKKKKNKKLMA